MADQISVPFSISADNADVLSGTQLDPLPYDGELQIFIASSQADTLWSLKLADDLVVDNRPVPQRTNGIPQQSDDPGYAQEVINGVKAKIVVDIVTGATVTGIATLIPG